MGACEEAYPAGAPNLQASLDVHPSFNEIHME